MKKDEITCIPLIDEFMQTTGSDRNFAESFLMAHNNDFEKAVKSYIGDDAFVPTPKKPKTEQLLPSSFNDPTRCAVIDPFRNFKAESSDWKDNALSNLFKPPLDLMFIGSFDAACIEALKTKKWLLINIQSTDEFDSHLLNRDVWSCSILSQLVLDNFVFWQQDRDSLYAGDFLAFYHPHYYPNIALIDPRTREKLCNWYGFVSSDILIEKLRFFLDNNDIDSNAPISKKFGVVDVAEMSESDALNAAINASLLERSTSCIQEHSEKLKSSQTSKDVPDLSSQSQLTAKSLIRVQVRLPDGSAIKCFFKPSDSIETVYNYVKLKLCTKKCTFSSFNLFKLLPKKLELSDLSQSVKDAKIRNSTLYVEAE